MTGSPLCRLARTWSASLLQQLTLKYEVSASRHCPVAPSRKRGVVPTRTLVTCLPVAVVRMFGSWATKPTRVTYPPWLISILLEFPAARRHRVPSTVPDRASRHRLVRCPVDNLVPAHSLWTTTCHPHQVAEQYPPAVVEAGPKDRRDAQAQCIVTELLVLPLKPVCGCRLVIVC